MKFAIPGCPVCQQHPTVSTGKQILAEEEKVLALPPSRERSCQIRFTTSILALSYTSSIRNIHPTMSLHRKPPDREDIITDPDRISSRKLFGLSQRDLSKRLPLSTSTRATFDVYLRWLEVQRLEESKRTEHWSNTVMHCTYLHGGAHDFFCQEYLTIY